VDLEYRTRQILVFALLEYGDLDRVQRETAPLVEHSKRPEDHLSLGTIGVATQHAGDLRQAATLLKNTAEKAAAHRDERSELSALSDLATCYLEMGRNRDAYGAAQATLSRSERGDRRVLPMVHVTLAGALSRMGRADLAQVHLQKALRTARDVRDRTQECEALIGQAELELSAGSFGAAIRLATEALGLARASMSRLRLARALVVLATCHRHRGELENARHIADEALSLASQCRYPLGQALAHAELAEIHRATGSHDSATQHWQHAEHLYTAIGSYRAAGNSLRPPRRPGDRTDGAAGPLPDARSGVNL
jgi:tetratricopeptide (TPR) repeat protein